MARKKTAKAKTKKPVRKTASKNFRGSDKSTSRTKIKIIGIGGGGCSIVSDISIDLNKVDFVAANTDRRSLSNVSKKTKTFHFGEKFTGGFGAGMDFELGRNAALEEKERIKGLLEGQDICILVASLGGGTGSGAVPVFSKIARETGGITYGIFTLPFSFEGSKKMEVAKNALEESRPHLNAVSVLPNENIFKIIDKNAPLKEALSTINRNLSESLKGLIEAIYNPGLINIDFADLKTVLEGRGKLAYINASVSDLSKGIEDAMARIAVNPFYSYGIDGANGVLLNISGSKKIGLKDISQISKKISESIKKNATIIFGVSHNEEHGDKIKTTLLAVGCEAKNIFPEKKVPAKEPKKTKKKPARKEALPKERSAVDVKVRKNGLQIKKDAEGAEKEILEEEKRWETPAFLRRGSFDKE